MNWSHFEERSCPRLPGGMLQEKIDTYRKGNEGDLHYFVHGIVTDSVDDMQKNDVDNKDIPIEMDPITDGGNLPKKRWKHLTCDGTGVVGVSRGTTTEASLDVKTTDDHYPTPLRKPERLNPSLPIVEEEKSCRKNGTL